ncbi:GRAM domain-containing protein 2A-like [Dromaius novaehollandiae]|uniref:GRAM domain-containing protein 2A-like n=1 Tax=Dromaius novaehollandiae TaxID=8790 RepID=UPI00311ECE1D
MPPRRHRGTAGAPGPAGAELRTDMGKDVAKPREAAAAEPSRGQGRAAAGTRETGQAGAWQSPSYLLARRLFLRCLTDSSVMSGKQKKSKKKVLEEKKWQSLEERGDTAAQQRRHLALARSKTCDPSFCKGTDAGKQGGSASALSKRTASFRKAFRDIAEKEALLACFSCAWQKEVPYHGRLYVSSSYVCFHSSLLLKDIKAVVPIPSISTLKKTNTALLVPNALSIRTAEGEKFLFVSLRRREATYQLLKSLCKHLQDNGQNSSPLTFPLGGSTEHILKTTLTSSQSDLGQGTLELSSLLDQPDGLSLNPSQAEEDEAVPARGRGGPHATVQTKTTVKDWLAQTSPLNTVIIIYLLLMVALLLSSGYIGLRIVELEQQLTAMGAWPDFSLQHQDKKT